MDPSWLRVSYNARMPATVIGPVDGVGVLGTGAAFPALELDNVGALGVLPGRRGPEQLAFAAKGLTQSIGVERRAWAHRVGDPLDHGSEATSLDLGIEAAKRAHARRAGRSHAATRR